MKEKAAHEIAHRVKDGERIGVGTGTTVDLALNIIGERIKQEKLKVQVVPTSLQSAWKCQDIGLDVLYTAYNGSLDWGFDGADAVNSKKWLIKGKGGAMLQEKILAVRCQKFYVIVDDSKITEDFENFTYIPIEIIPEAIFVAQRELTLLGAKEIKLRNAVAKHGPVITEASNIILDVKFNKVTEDLEKNIKKIVGVVESGLFIDYATEIIVSSTSGISFIK